MYEVNELCKGNIKELFVGCLLGKINTKTGELCYINASGTVNAPNETKGSILSVFRQCIKVYASKLAKSSDLHSKYIGRYSLAKALKDEGYANTKEEYQDLLRFLSNEMIKDPSDLMALSFRVQCYIDLGEFDEAEKLCKVLSDDIRKPLEKKINEARSGGDT